MIIGSRNNRNTEADHTGSRETSKVDLATEIDLESVLRNSEASLSTNPSTLAQLKDIKLFHTSSIILAVLANRFFKFEPVECSFGRVSVIGNQRLEHHGPFSGEDPVSVKSERLASNPGFQKLDRFVVAGSPDPDAVFAILRLSGAIQSNPSLAASIGKLDLDPVGIQRRSDPELRNAAFDMGGPYPPILQGWYNALAEGLKVFGPKELDRSLAAAALEYEDRRIRLSRAAVVESAENVVFVISELPCRDVWHEYAPVVVQFNPLSKRLTLSGCSELAAQRLGTKSIYDVLGSEGLGEFYPMMSRKLGTSGSGGRPEIGGSPRSRAVCYEEALAVYDLMVNHLAQRIR